ncbi:hypothetical protein BT96DRAFT_253073 [Gymnopus androsaceus JB14]|uniref:Uncharacterized protein n=1 Tax=Gymnopus androsaceus JB14 TaxID=1447944 RepID=A0A6A4ICC4_9AGAR|nr:hypothetical protein BT96DRAFT_253073 [Gymnopus androsaceus JB14]
MDLDADLYGDLYDTDIAQADESESPTQAAKPELAVSSAESVEEPEKTPAIETSSIPTYSSSYQTPVATGPPVQQIPTYEDPATANYSYRDTSSLQQSGYEQNYSSPEHRSVRPSEMKDDGLVFCLVPCFH